MIENIDVVINDSITNLEINESQEVEVEEIIITQYSPSDTYLRSEIDQKLSDLNVWYVAQW